MFDLTCGRIQQCRNQDEFLRALIEASVRAVRLFRVILLALITIDEYACERYSIVVREPNYESIN